MPRTKVLASDIIPGEVQAPTVPLSEGGTLDPVKPQRTSRTRIPMGAKGGAKEGDMTCMSCKARTPTVGGAIRTLENNRKQETGQCGICDKKKCRFVGTSE